MAERKKKTAEEMAREQKEISISEFFEKNKHLLGFDNPTKALLMCTKEFVDNSLDACEEAAIIPDISVKVRQLRDENFRVTVQDNGPGIVKENIGRVFGKLLYGSKFFKLSQSLTGDEPVIILRNGKVEILPIGNFVDTYLGPGDEEFDISDLNVSVPAFDRKSQRYTIRNVSHVIRHKRRNEIIKIRLATKREIKVTGCHSLFALNDDGDVVDIEARELKKGDCLVIPRRLPPMVDIREINVLDYLSSKQFSDKYLYVYGIDKSYIKELIHGAEVIHKTTDKSRKYYRIKTPTGIYDILDDSYKQYADKGFLPLHLVLRLGINNRFKDCVIQTYHHGKITKFPVSIELTESFMRFLGLYVAEGHCDRRQIGFTLGKHEDHYINEIVNFAKTTGLSATIEPRDTSIRVKIFGGPLHVLMEIWCGRGAKNKKIPEFVFRTDNHLQTHFLSGYIDGDGHRGKDFIQATTVSKELTNQMCYLFLMQGKVASISKRMNKGLGKTPSECFNIFVFTGHGTKVFETFPKEMFHKYYNAKRGTSARKLFEAFGLGFRYNISKKFESVMENINYGSMTLEDIQKILASQNLRITKTHINFLEKNGYASVAGGCVSITSKGRVVLNIIHKMRAFSLSDLCIVPIEEIEVIDEGYEYIYDLSVPVYENFIGGFGGISCHNSRGQQGIGASACVLYSQLTTGSNTKIWSKTEKDKKMHYYELQIDTKKNEPVILKEDTLEPTFEHGVKVELDVVGRYRRWVDDYLKQTSIANPFAKISYTAPDGTKTTFPRSINELPKPAKEMKPHPYGIEFGIIQRMLASTASRSLLAFLTNEFSSVGAHTAREMCKVSKLNRDMKPAELDREQIEKLLNAMQKVRVQRPPTDCLSPIGKDELETSLKREFPTAEFIISRSREPEVYRGFPFQIEIGIVYGGELKEDTIEVFRVANRVPLLYQAGACATTEAVKETDWKRYGLNQQSNALPTGKMVLVVHMASVWVPFVSESKEAIAPYPDIVKEMKLAIQDAGRELSRYLSGKRRAGEQKRRILIFERYSTEVAEALSRITGKNKNDIEKKLKSFIGERVKINEEGEVEGIEGAKEGPVEEKTQPQTAEERMKQKREKQTTLKSENRE